MKRELYIDDTDVYESYGVWITEGGYDGLLSFPALVAPDKNVWPEEDGIEVDLENPVLSGKELTIPFVASDPAMDVDEFVTFVARPGYRTIRVPALGREWRLRLLSEPSRVTYGRTADRLVSFSLKFADDFPLREDVYPAAQGGGVALPESSYSLDGVAFDTYGIMVEEGRDSALKFAAVRQNLTRKFSTMDGVLYDADTVVFSEKDVTLKCLMVTDTMERFWKCYIAFFNDLIQPGERYLGYGETGKSYKCHYKSTFGWSLASLSGRVMVEFNLTLVFTAFRGSGDVTYLLATEDGAFVTTEEDDRFIDMSLTRKTVSPGLYAPALSVDEPLSASTSDNLPVEILKRKISEMPGGASLDNMIVPVVNRTTNRNYHIPAKSIWYAGLPGARRLPELTDVDDGVDSATDGDILLREKDRWIHADPSSVLPPPVIRSLSIVGRFDTYDDLEAAFPGGPDEDGIYAVGTQPPYDYYAYSLVDGLWRWDGQGRLQMPDAYLRLFREVTPSGNKITVNAATTRYAMVTLSGESVIYGLTITNATDGDEGYILVFQTGFKQLSLSKGILGTVDLPLKDGTVAMLIYNKVGGTIYIRTHVILGDVEFPTPQRIKDFQVVYYDSSSCTVQWSSPWANNIYDKGTEYDMRYANSPANADDPKVWAGLRRVEGVPLPADPGTLQRMTITGLVPNKEYYVYLKTVKTNYGVEYLSDASDFAYFRTIGSEDMSKAYRIPLDERNLVEQLRESQIDTDGTVCSVDKMVDETERNVYQNDGYPDTTNKGYSTYWLTYKYSRAGSPYDIIIDLFSVYAIDRLFIYSRGKPRLSVYGMRDIGYAWEKIGEISISYDSWANVDFHTTRCRLVMLSFDLMDFGATGGLTEGQEGFPNGNEYNDTIDRIDNLILYGRPSSTRPDGIMSPLRRSTARKTADQFLCTNGHGYQQGRIHSLCSGEKVRCYMPYDHFAAEYGTAGQYTTLKDMRFRISDIPWVKDNNGTGDDFETTLRETWRRYGLRPYLTNTDTFKYCSYDTSTYRFNRQLDNYWLPGAWKALPKRGIGGLAKYLETTEDPENYKTVAKVCYALAAKYGRVDMGEMDGLFWPSSASRSTGLDLISGLEPENEPDANWNGWVGYEHADEYAAVISASADGHCGTLKDEENRVIPGAHGGGIFSISSGTAGVNTGYMLPAILHWKARRKDATIPVDAFSLHMYFSNVGSQGSSNAPVQYGITFEEAMGNSTGGQLPKVCALRDRVAPDKEVWLTEFGWGESGARETACKFQCYSQAGRRVGNWTIPDRHRSDVKGAWVVRACIQMMDMGVDMVNYYSTECENNYFDAGQWGQGAGFEMFHWNDCQDMTPGARVEAIKAHECTYPRGDFATTGLFGQLLGNGGYPITRAYWWIATFRNRLKGYVYTGMRYIDTDNRIVVACFKKKDEDKGAYVVYLNDNQNMGVEGVEIPVPAGVLSYEHVTVYVPEIPNPENVPSSLGWDKERTGLPTSRKEKYVGGKWVVQNRPYYENRYMSYTKSPASYPENPAEGDEITTLPTAEENPYFPIVGPVWAKSSPHKNILSARQFEQDRENWEDEPEMDADGEVIWTVRDDPRYSWRQVDAICDYIELHPEGIHGRNGDEVTGKTIRGMIQANVSEFPEFFFFDAVPEPDYKSEVTDLSSRTVSSSAIELWWNNTNVEDTGYEIFVSDLPTVGYTLLKTVGMDVENKALISGLTPDTTYYYKIRPVRGDKIGTLSDYISAKTYNDIQPPTNLRVDGRTATSITLAWDYVAEQVADFVSYAIYRSENSGAFAQVATVGDQRILKYQDTGLAVGRTYGYKIRVVGLNGTSAYTGEIETRTLLPEEVTPVLRSVITDKLGSKVTLTFDLPIGTVPEEAKTAFMLTEDGNVRLIQRVYRDEANHNNLVLAIPQDSLSDYDKKTDIRVSYDGLGGILSDYGVTLEGFSNIKVANVIGNFTNINAIYQVNLCDVDAADVPDWNNLGRNETVRDTVSLAGLVDTYGRTSSISIAAPYNGTTFSWGDVYDGYCEITDIPQSVWERQWGLAHGNTLSESVRSRITLTGLVPEYRYTVKAYGGSKYGMQRSLKMRIGDVYSPAIPQIGNTTNMVVIEGVAPVKGAIDIDLINPIENISTEYPLVGFIIIEEYKSNDAPENTDIWLRGATIVEDTGDGIVKFPDVTIHLNCVGMVTACRIGETQDLSLMDWVDIIDGEMDVPYTLTSAFGKKTLYVQVKNLYSESNIRVIDIEYRDPYVPLVLKNIYVNNDDAVTYNDEVTVLADKEGIPTHYRVSEVSDLSAVAWLDWPNPKGSTVPYRLSEGSGQKTVYMQVKDDITESAMRVDTIEYLTGSGILTSITINGGMNTTVSGDLSIGFVVVGTPTMMMLSESPDFAGAAWKAFENPTVFTVSGLGAKTVYAKVKISDALVSDVRTAGIELVETPPMETRKMIISLGWEGNSFDPVIGVNRIEGYLTNLHDLKWDDGTAAGSMQFTGTIPCGLVDNRQGAVTGDNSFDYSDEYMRYNIYLYRWNNTVKEAIKFTLPAGDYRIRLFNSTVEQTQGTKPYYGYFVVTSGYGTDNETRTDIPLPNDYEVYNNISKWIDVDVTTTGEFWIGMELYKAGGDNTVAMNIIEIIPK